jgi:hypothetical protein
MEHKHEKEETHLLLVYKSVEIIGLVYFRY